MRMAGNLGWAAGQRLLAAVVIVGLLTAAWPAAAAGPFADVPAGHWAYNALEQLSEAGLVDGYPAGFFSGSRRLTRYEVALSVAKALERLSERVAIRPPAQDPRDLADLWSRYNDAYPDRPLPGGLRDLLGTVVREFEPELSMLGYGALSAALQREPGAAVMRVEAAAAEQTPDGGAHVAAWEHRADGDVTARLALGDYVLPGTRLLTNGGVSGGAAAPLSDMTETLSGVAGVVPVTPYLSLRGERLLRSSWQGEAGVTEVGASVRLGDVSLDGRVRSVEPGFETGFRADDPGGEAIGVGLTVPLGDLRLITGRDVVQRASDSVEHVTSLALEYNLFQTAQLRAQWQSVSLADLKQSRSRASVDVNLPVFEGGAVHVGLAYEGAPDPDTAGISVTTLAVAGLGWRLQENAEARAAIAIQETGAGSQLTTSLGLRYTLSPEAALRLGYKLIDFTDKDTENVTTAEFTIRF